MMRAHLLLAGFLVGCLCVPAPTAAQPGSPAIALPAAAEIRRLLATRVDAEQRNVGIVVGIVTPAGRRIVSHGAVSLNDKRGLDGDTVFEIGSVTKVFTSMLLADMVRRGEVALTDSVFAYLPPHTARARENRTITLADLATHTSGLPLWPSGIPATRDGVLAMTTYTQAQLLDYLSTFQVPVDVGRKWAYSNADAGVLGLALGNRANSRYDALLEARVTGPLSLRSTAVVLSDGMRARLAVGHDAERRPAPAWSVPALAGAGSLHSTANDLLMFLGALGDNTGPLRPGRCPGMSESVKRADLADVPKWAAAGTISPRPSARRVAGIDSMPPASLARKGGFSS